MTTSHPGRRRVAAGARAGARHARASVERDALELRERTFEPRSRSRSVAGNGLSVARRSSAEECAAGRPGGGSPTQDALE